MPALLDDNPHLDRDAYRQSLAQLDDLTRAQLERGQWVRDIGGLIYPYRPEINGAEMLPEGIRWRYALGVDFGAGQSAPTTAFVVLAYTHEHPAAYVVESEARAGMTVSDIAERIKAYTYNFDAIIGDQGGLGRGYLDEMIQRWQIPIEQAMKANKLGYRKLLRGDLERGALKVLEAGNRDLVEEMGRLSWDERGLDCEKGAADHLSDALLYVWRAAKHWLHQEKPAVPAFGTPEHADWLAAKIEQAEDDRNARDARREWWE